MAHWMWADSVVGSSQLLSVLLCGLSQALLKREALSDRLFSCLLFGRDHGNPATL